MRDVLHGLQLASCVNMRAFPLFAWVLIVPGLCLGQTLPISVSGGVVVSGVNRFGPIHCGATFTVSWGIPTPAQISQTCALPEFWISSAACGDHPASGDLVLSPSPPIQLSSRSGTFNPVNVNDLPIFQTTDGGGVCGSYSGNATLNVCGSVAVPSGSFVGCGTNTIVRGSNPQIQYRGSAPPAPSIDVAALDGALNVSASVSSTDVSLVHVEMREAGVGDFAEVATFSPDRGSTRISGLQNGTAYEVRAYSDDGVGNYSARTQTITATPVKSNGFYQNYRELGGTDTGGCGGALPGALGVPLALGAYRFLRRKR